jgi:predicted phosphodiesterase
VRIAVISDIHGNLLALDAVLADIGSRAVDLTVNLGDVVSGPLWPQETAECLVPLGLLTISGNHERQLSTATPAQMGPSDRFAHDALTADQRAWLGSLPATATLPNGVLLVHGTPSSDLEYLLETVEVRGARPATLGEIEQHLADTPAALVLCGHTHVPRVAALPGGMMVANPGSVGLPAYQDDEPFPHVMEAGTPHARYAIADNATGTWQVDLRSVAYEWEAAARQAETNLHPTWAQALRSGLV